MREPFFLMFSGKKGPTRVPSLRNCRGRRRALCLRVWRGRQAMITVIVVFVSVFNFVTSVILFFLFLGSDDAKALSTNVKSPSPSSQWSTTGSLSNVRI